MAAIILSVEDDYPVAAWAKAEALADLLVAEARLLGIEPREHAEERMVSVAASFAAAAMAAEQTDLASRPDDIAPGLFGQIGELLYNSWATS